MALPRARLDNSSFRKCLKGVTNKFFEISGCVPDLFMPRYGVTSVGMPYT